MKRKLVKTGTNKKKLFNKTSGEKISISSNTPAEQEPLYSTLDEVMDRTRDISFFYSGVEYANYLDGCYDMGIRNFLMSYHYLSGRGLKDIFETHPDIHLLVDSGAFTYTTDVKYEDWTLEQWEKHIERYLKWAERNKEHIFAIANLDIERLVGIPQVMEWNKKYFEPFMLRTGVPVCFVYHADVADGTDENYTWSKYCERYPYVGFSSVNTNNESIDMNDYREYLRTAEKYGTLVHGFGMTRIKELSELPYYTVDSTTWKVGMRFGKLIIFNGTTVQQISKEDWNDKALPLIRNYPIEIDEDLLWDYYEPEVIRANVYAFIQAENYVKDSIKHLQYWKKAKAKQLDLDNLPDDFFPSVEWLMDDNKTKEDIQRYASQMNINPDRDHINKVALTVIDMTSFVNWDNPVYESMHEAYTGDNISVLHELHDKYINRIVPDDEKRINDLKQFYRECLSGKRDTLLQEGTNFDRVVKERDEYVDDTEYTTVELSREDVLSKIGLMLPESTEEGAPEIDELDEEIFEKVGIKPVYDSKGRFVKGNQLVKNSRKNLYSKKFPKFACDTCNAAAKCPEYKAGYVCAYSKLFTGFDTRNADDILQAMQGMANHNLSRMQRAMVMETINGTIDDKVTAMIDQNMRLMNTMLKLHENSKTVQVRQTRTVNADGSFVEATTVSNPQSGSILEQLFSQNRKSETPKSEPKDVTSETIEADYKEISEDGNNGVTFSEE